MAVKTRKNQNGFSLIEVLMTVAVGSIVFFGVAHVISLSGRAQKQAHERITLDSFKRDLLHLLGNQLSWSLTVGSGVSLGPSQLSKMDCLANQTDCSGVADQLFDLYDSSGELFYDSTNPQTGLSANGMVCRNFTSLGNPQCPFRIELRWTPVCAGAPCINPLVSVTARVLNPLGTELNGAVLNTERFGINNYLVDTANNSRICRLQSALFFNPGVYSFRVPTYTKLVAEVWGGGGGGAGLWSARAGSGGASSFRGAVIAGGGQGGAGNSWWFWMGGPFGFSAGGIASGGLLNINGGSTNWLPGGSAPSSGLQSILKSDPCVQNAVGGSGGPGHIPSDACSGGDGRPGGYAGGGGSGTWSCQGLWWLMAGWGFASMGGGGGAYAAQAYSPGGLAVGSTVTVVVGAGGVGARGAATAGFPSWSVRNPPSYTGGDGAHGLVKITWE